MTRRILTWSILALFAVLALTTAVLTHSRSVRPPWPVFLSASPAQGQVVFQTKGCSHCHSINGVGGKLGPDLGRNSPAHTSVPQLVTAMWNHAPQMWSRMRVEKVGYPTLDYQDAAELLTYLYMARFVDGPGDARHGRELFTEQSCDRCHTLHGGRRVGPDLAADSTPISVASWIQTMWNHSWAMQDQMERAGVAWPVFQENELRDLLTYVRVARGVAAAEDSTMGDPERGWAVFQGKGCSACHSIREDDGSDAPNLGPRGQAPQTLVQFGSAMLNHSPQMRRVMEQRGIHQPAFEGGEMADVAAFLYSLSYVEPTGSPHVGKSVFAWRGCSRCHGDEAQGTSNAPGLRGRGQAFTAVRMATSLWGHGERMYHRSQQIGIGWPTLADADVGDILSFLNAPLEPSMAHR